MNPARWLLVVTWGLAIAMTTVLFMLKSSVATPFLIAAMLFVGLIENHLSPAGGWLEFIGRNRWIKAWMGVYVVCLVGFLTYAVTSGIRITEYGNRIIWMIFLGLLAPGFIAGQREFRRVGSADGR